MNKALTAVLLLALASGAQGQQKPKAAPAKPAGSPAPAAEAAPAPTAAPADPAAEILGKLKAWDEKIENLAADFTQEVNFTEAGLKRSVEGSLSYVKPNLLRIEHTRPSRQVVVTDKSDIWIYKQEDNQAVRTRWETWRRTQDQNFSGILDFGNYAALTDRNTATVSGGKDGAPWSITFKPRSGSGYSLTLTLSAEDYFPQEARLEVDGTVISTRLLRVRRNAGIDPAVFKFKPPRGAEILDFGK